MHGMLKCCRGLDAVQLDDIKVASLLFADDVVIQGLVRPSPPLCTRVVYSSGGDALGMRTSSCNLETAVLSQREMFKYLKIQFNRVLAIDCT